MDDKEQSNYKRIAEAIEYIRANYQEQPSLDEIAEKVHLSPSHFQRLFTDWAGVSPKKFLQYISIQHAKALLNKAEPSLFDVSNKIGLSSTSRLHDLFIQIEGMTPGEYKNGGAHLSIEYSFSDSAFGKVIIASTPHGICHLTFIENEADGLTQLKSVFPNATYLKKINDAHSNALLIFSMDWSKLKQVKLHLKGTEFQLKVWEALLKIPMGVLTSYGDIAATIQKPSASRAVGTAIGSNPIAFLIPCHRVIQASGNLGGYMWGITRKTAMIGWESSKQLSVDSGQ
ncbi:methylated-DNA--[protein]-cysteine S-methyltransferase [Cytophaga aurantiaca]|uniref:methylated-DNA--[protein]-cysteine S-methyltransferase n=1 Tax=Cytophaga aurantiaca TaxID=29530 RepID=UPI000360B489|nr:methylated-DNA--[protein]-cysteine S-methyltransferase [Cytophaga aurantiaca]